MTQNASRARVHSANTLAARRRPLRFPRIAAALLTLGLFAASGTVANAASHTPTTVVDAATSATPTAEVTLAPLAQGIVTEGASLSVSVVVQNPTIRALPATSASLEIGSTPISDRATLQAWQSGSYDWSTWAFFHGGDASLESVPAGETTSAGITVDAEHPELAALPPGVYPLLLRYGSAESPTFSTSTMIVRDAAAEARPFEIGIVVPITAPALSTGLLSAAQLTALTEPEGDLTALLDAVQGTPAILAVDPAVPASIRVLGTAAPATARAWLDRLDALPNERFSTAFGDGDLATSFTAGLPTPFAPSTLQAYMQPANFVPVPSPLSPSASAPSVGPSGAPPAVAENGSGETLELGDSRLSGSPTPGPGDTTDAPDTPVYPDLAAVLAVDGARPGIAWPATGTASTALIEHLAAWGAETSGATLLSSANTAAGADARTVTARGTAAGASVLIYDSAISAALHDAVSVRTPALRGAPLAAAAAQLTLAGAEASGPLFVTLDRGSNRTRSDLSAALTVAQDTPGATPIGLEALLAAEPQRIDIVDAPTSDIRADAARRLIATEAQIADFATVLDDPAQLTTPERAAIAQLLGAQWRNASWPQDKSETPEDVWNEAIVEHEAASAKTLSSVGILPPSTTNLLSADAKLQFWVRNDLPYPVNVLFITSPNDLRLEVARNKSVTALPNSNTRVEVPVIAKVGSGDVQLQLELRSPTLQPIGEPVRAEVVVRADWEFIGALSLAVIVSSLFVLGIIRTVLSRRGRRAAIPTSQDGDIDG